MSNVFISFFLYLFFQFVTIVVGFNVVRVTTYGITETLKSWVFGNILLYAIFQIIAVPMILLRLSFSILFWSYVGIVLTVFWAGLRRIKRIKISKPKLSTTTICLFLIIALIIAYQCGIYIFGMHLDEDDARWIAEANDAIETGDMLTRSHHTGEYIGKYTELADVISPWSMIAAVISVMIRSKPSVFLHTIYPPIALLLVYGIYYLISESLFKKQITRFAFVLFVGIIMMFFSGTVYTQSTFTLVRIWQGKASVAGIIIPLLFYLFISINIQDRIESWIKVILVGIAACLMSGMGVMIGLVMIAVYGFMTILLYQKWKKIPIWIASCLPSLLYAFLKLVIKG